MLQALDNRGLPVWFERTAIEAGDPWSHVEQKGIRNAVLFLPVISKNSAVDQSESQREWNLSIDVNAGVASDATFIVPIVIDDTGLGAMNPSFMTSAYKTRFPGYGPLQRVKKPFSMAANTRPLISPAIFNAVL
ncbi:MAG: hypothetical protein ACJAYE_002314 [Candidatus Azotimanducaceae bacterium]|jgi:hypothetical protein